MDCPKCGYAMTPFDLDCPRCARMGKQTDPVVPIPSPMAQVMQTLGSDLTCASCASPDVRKVSALVQAGTVITHTNGTSMSVGGMSGGGDFVAVGSVEGVSVGQTALVKMLSPPPPPSVQKNPYEVLIAVLFLIGGPCLLGGIAQSSSGYESGSGWLTVGIVCTGLGFYMGISDRVRINREKAWCEAEVPSWNAAMYKWEKLFFCSRCGCVFNIQTRQTAPPEEMERLLQ